MSRYEAYLSRATSRYPGLVDISDLEPSFIPFYESGQRIKVHLHMFDREMTGTVGVTTGHRPCFILMRSTHSQGNQWTLGPNDRILAVQRNSRTYTPVTR